MVVRELINLVGFKIDDKQMKKAEQSVTSFKNKAAGILSQIGPMLGAAGIAGGLFMIGKAAVTAAGDMEMLTTQFEVMLGDAKKANEMMTSLKKFASETPFAIKDLAQGSQNLLSFGVAAKDTISTMRMLGDTAGGSNEKLKTMVLAFGKATVKGKADLEVLNMIAERGVPIFDTLAKQLGMTKAQFMSMKGGVKVTSEELKKAFQTMTSQGGMFFKGMEKQSLTFQGMVSTLKDNFTLLLADLGSILLPIVKKVVGLLTKLIQGPIQEILNVVKAVLVPVLDLVSGLIDQLFKALNPLFGMLKDIMKIVQPILDIIIGFINTYMGMLMELVSAVLTPIMDVLKIIMGVVQELLVAFKPIIDIIFQLIAMGLIGFLMPFIAPLIIIANILKIVIQSLRPLIDLLFEVLKPILKIFGITNKEGPKVLDFIKLITKTLEIVGQVIGTVIGLAIRLSTVVLTYVLKPVKWVIGKIAEFVGWLLGKMFKWFGKFWDWALKKFAGLIKFLKKIGLDIKLPDIKRMQANFQGAVKREMKISNVSVKNNINFDQRDTGGKKGAGKKGKDKADANLAFRAGFTVELQKILVTTLN